MVNSISQKKTVEEMCFIWYTNLMKLTQKHLILIVGIGTLIIAGGLVVVAWYYQVNSNKVTQVSNNNINATSNLNTASNINTNNQPACSSLATEQECIGRVDCYGIYGPSKCEGGACTTDLAYKYCATNYRYSNCLTKGGTWNSEGKTASEQCICPAGTSFTERGYTCDKNEDIAEYNSYKRTLADGVLEESCPRDMFDERNNKYDPYYAPEYTVNDGCQYNKKSGDLVIENNLKINNCASTISKEIANNVYNFINGCLYRNGVRMFEKTIHSQVEAGEFGELNPRWGIGEGADEWFRMVQGNRLTFFFRGAAGCGGCVFNGPYLTINKNTGAVIKRGNNESIPYLPSVVLSPNHTLGIEIISSEEDTDAPLSGVMPKTEFYLYDFVNLERKKLVYEYPLTKGTFSCGDGCYPADGLVTWLDDDSISIQIFKTEQEDNYNPLRANDGSYISDGSPKVINI